MVQLRRRSTSVWVRSRRPTTRQMMVDSRVAAVRGRVASRPPTSGRLDARLHGPQPRPRLRWCTAPSAATGTGRYMVAVTNGDGGDSIRNVLDHADAPITSPSQRPLELGLPRRPSATRRGRSTPADLPAGTASSASGRFYYADRTRQAALPALGDVLNVAGVDLALELRRLLNSTVRPTAWGTHGERCRHRAPRRATTSRPSAGSSSWATTSPARPGRSLPALQRLPDRHEHHRRQPRHRRQT